MKFWPFKQEEKRSLENPAVSLSDPEAYELFGVTPSASGVSVSPESALSLPAVLCAVKRISGSLSSLPLHTYSRSENGKAKATNHPLYRTLKDRWCPELSAVNSIELLVLSYLIYGDAFFEIERAQSGQPKNLWYINPLFVTVERQNGAKVYRVQVDGIDVVLQASDVIHVQGPGLQGMRGLYPIQTARQALGLSLAQESYTSSYYKNGAQPSGVLEHPGKLSPEGVKNIRDGWNAIHAGPTNSQRVAILESGVKYAGLSFSPEQSESLASRQWSTTQVSQIFGIPPHLINDLSRSTYSNIEQQSLEYAIHTLTPLCRKIEAELSWKLFDDGEFYCEFALEGLLRGDSQSRAAYYQTMFGMGALSPNDIRALENMTPVAGGDERFIPLNLAPLGASREVPTDDK